MSKLEENLKNGKVIDLARWGNKSQIKLHLRWVLNPSNFSVLKKLLSADVPNLSRTNK